jgi:hypothetical protein
MLGSINIKSHLYHICLTYVQPTGAGEAGKKVTYSGKLTARKASKGRPWAESRRPRCWGGEEGGPGPGRRRGCRERAGPRSNSPGRPDCCQARPGTAGESLGVSGVGVTPLSDGAGTEKVGACHRASPAGAVTPSPRLQVFPARRSPGHAAGRAPVHLPGGVQVHLHRGGGAAWPRAAGRRGARGHRDGHGGGGGRGRGGGNRRRGGRGGRGGLGQLGGRRLLRRLLLRRLLLRGLGDPRAPLAAAAPSASGTTARPSAFRHGPATGRGAWGLRRPRGRREAPGLPPRRRRRQRGLSVSLQPARRSASRQQVCTHARGLTARGPRARPPHCLLRPARQRHWVGVSGKRAGSPGSRPHPAPGAKGRGPGSRSRPAACGRASLQLVGGGCCRRMLAGLPSNRLRR